MYNITQNKSNASLGTLLYNNTCWKEDGIKISWYQIWP